MYRVTFCVLVCLVASLVNLACATLVPEHVYLTLTGVPSEMQVSFTTTTSPSQAQVEYWLDGVTTKTIVNVTKSDITKFTRPVTAQNVFINSVTLEDLKRGELYHYKIIGDAANATGTTSKQFSFTHIPEDGKPVTLGIYGDLGSYGYAIMQESADGLASWAAQGKFDVIIHNGDLAYNMGTNNGTVGDDFMKNVQPVMSTVPYMVTPGNHEFMNSGDDEKYYKNYFAGQTMLGKNSKSTSPTMWWSFDIGTVHVVGMSTEVYCEDTTNIATQYDWLENDLKTAYGKTPRPWIVVFGHRPLYEGETSHIHARLMRKGLQCTNDTLKSCSPLKSCDSGKNCAYSIEDLLVRYEVDMFNAGHVHSYIRHNPIYPNITFESHPDLTQYVNPKATVHIISGAAGTAHTPSSASVSDGARSGATPAVLSTTTYSFSTLQAYNASALHYRQISAEDGKVVDEFWMLKNQDAPKFKVVPFTLNDDAEGACNQ